MPEEQLWTMFAAAILASGNGNHAKVESLADTMVNTYKRKFPQVFRKYDGHEFGS